MRFHSFSFFGPRVQAAVIQDDVLAGLPFEVQMLKQVHGDTVLDVEHLPTPKAGDAWPEGDAIFSRQAGLKLLIKTADCQPLVFADEAAGLVAAVHAGWRSLVADIVPKTLATMAEQGAEPQRIRVGIGPSLGTCCSHFSAPHEEIPEAYHWAILPDKRVDLNAIAQRQLTDFGVLEERIHRMSICTACDPDWFSWRRDAGHERMGTFIELLH